MGDVVRDAIAASLLEVTPVVSTPAAPFGYGTDLSCTTDLTPTMEDVDGFTTLALAQALVRRLDCPRGALPDDPNYGEDVRGMCNRGTGAAELRELAGRIRAELQKDDRLESARVTVTPASDGSSLTVQLAVVPVDPELGPFSLTLAVSPAAILIAALEGGA